MSWHQMEEEEGDSHVPLLTDQERRGGREDEHAKAASPAISTVSTQSHEVKHILDPPPSLAERDTDTTADYSHIHIRPKPRATDSMLRGRPPPPAYQRPDANPATHFQNIQSGFAPGNVHRYRTPPEAATLEDVSGYELSRRKSWSPPLLRQGIGGYHSGQKNMRSCYSSNMVDWEMSQPGYPAPNPPAYHQTQTSQSHYQQCLAQSHAHGVHGHQLSHGNCEEIAENMPPRLAPVSGVPPEKMSRNLIRPIAFKPANSRGRPTMCLQCGEDASCCYCSGPQTSQGHPLHLPADFFYPTPRPPSSVRSTGHSSIHSSSGHGNHRSTGYSSEAGLLDGDSPGVNVDHSPSRKVSMAGSEIVVQTPSPSDSGVGELEAMLKEREAEILTLRQVMDRNERAIFQVYEEKKTQWLRDMQEIRDDYEHKLKVQQQKAGKLEQALALQVRRLQQEKQQMQGKYTNLHMEKEAAARLNNHNRSDSYTSESESTVSSATPLTPQNPSCSSAQSSPGDAVQQLSLQEEMALKNTEVMALKSQLHSLQAQLEDKDQQIFDTLTQMESKSEELKLVHEQLDQLSAVDGASLCEEGTQTSDTEDETRSQPCAELSGEEYSQSLEKQIDCLRQQLHTSQSLLETERIQWLEEKNKVIRYQKQLQLNYVQMQRKNTALEAEVEQLTLELESRHLKLAALNGEESVC